MTYQTGDGNTGETIIIGRAGQPVNIAPGGGLVSFGSASPSAASTAATSVTTTAAIAISSGYGFASGAQADAIVTGLNAVIAALKAKGIMAS